MAALLKSLDSGQAFGLGFGLQTHDPIQGGYCVVIIPKENDANLRHTTSPTETYICEIIDKIANKVKGKVGFERYRG
jgi:diadenosine tetraphosphate (Ap4A) HIT family hydrolase